MLQVGDVGIPEAAVDPQQNHRLHRQRSGVEQPADFVSREDLLATFCLVLSEYASARLLELRSEADRAVNKAVLETVLEDHLNAGDHFRKPNRSPALSQFRPQRFEVIGGEIVHEPFLAECVADEVGRLLVFEKRSPGNLTGLQPAMLRGVESVAEFLDRQAVLVLNAGSSISVKIFGLRLVDFKCILPTVIRHPLHLAVDAATPVSEVNQLTPDFLHPLPRRMRRQREIRVRLRRNENAFALPLFWGGFFE